MKFKQLREKYRSKFPSSLVSAAVKIAIDMGGNMTGAYKKIEAMKKGLSKDKLVQDALRQANESVKEQVSFAFKTMPGAQKFQKKVDGKPINIVKVGTGKYFVVDLRPDTSPNDRQKAAKIAVQMGLNEGTEVKEGTWDIPDTKTKLQKLMDLVSKPYFATTEKEVDKYLSIMPFGDDELYDDLGVLYFIPGSQKSKKFPKTDLNQVAMDSLNGRWLTAKKKGKGWDITHINFDVDMDETIKRKSGNMRPGKRMKVDLSAGSKY